MTEHFAFRIVREGDNSFLVDSLGRRYLICASSMRDRFVTLSNHDGRSHVLVPPRAYELRLSLVEVPTPPAAKPKRRSWATEMGLRKP